MKKLLFCATLFLSGLATSCVDKNELVDEDSKPDWLGASIYEELKNPNQERLTGSFSTYLRLVDDLGYADVLGRTGSVTVFPANDEAFGRFFQSNEWGVHSYADLSEAQKKLLMRGSMIPNALLLNMLANSSSNGNIVRGVAVRHESFQNVIDTIQVLTPAEMPKNNPYWKRFIDRNQSVRMVSDNTTPMVVHFTREYMLNNGMTTLGDQSDFAIITGSPYKEGSAYIFDDEVINGDVTCMNGYVHQVKDVLVPPGNIGQVLRKDGETTLMSRLVDYYAVPAPDADTKRAYDDWAMQNVPGYVPNTQDTIYQMRYLSSNSQGSEPLTRVEGFITTSDVLKYDLGWNQYYPKPSRRDANTDYASNEMGAFFVPTDQAMKDFFLGQGAGAYLLDMYGDKENTEANLAENLDSLRSKQPTIITDFVKNLMQTSFSRSVPSKFKTIQNDASENLGIDVPLLDTREDGKYDIKIANNGVIFKLREMVAPDKYRSVMAPAATYTDMRVMRQLVENRNEPLNVDFQFYLLAMSANYAFFTPEDSAFAHYYLDPTSLGRPVQRVLKFTHNGEKKAKLQLDCEAFNYDVKTGTVGASQGMLNIGDASGAGCAVTSQLIDILNFHTVVLATGETLGTNHYYKTKHGGAIYLPNGGAEGAQVMGGSQVDNGMEPAEIKAVYGEKNGNAYRIDHLIQAPQNSVYKTLSNNPNFSDFLDLCDGFDAELLKWAGISNEKNEFNVTPQDAYISFTNTYGTGDAEVAQACVDYNVKFFNTYNYTLYAPNNDAMQEAFTEKGLPTWDDIWTLYNKWDHEEDIPYAEASAAEKADRDLAFLKINTLRDFVRYHFQSSSVYVDNVVPAATYQSMCTDATGVAFTLKVAGAKNGGHNSLQVTDAAGNTVSVVDDGVASVNNMTRDYWFNANATTEQCNTIVTSSFCAVHEMPGTLCPYKNSNGRFDGAWANSGARSNAQQLYKKLKAQGKL